MDCNCVGLFSCVLCSDVFLKTFCMSISLPALETFVGSIPFVASGMFL